MPNLKKITLLALFTAFLPIFTIHAMEPEENDEANNRVRVVIQIKPEDEEDKPIPPLTQEEKVEITAAKIWAALGVNTEENVPSSGARQLSPEQEKEALKSTVSGFLSLFLEGDGANQLGARFAGKLDASARHRQEEEKNFLVYGQRVKDRQRRQDYGIVRLSDEEESRILAEKGYKWENNQLVYLSK